MNEEDNIKVMSSADIEGFRLMFVKSNKNCNDTDIKIKIKKLEEEVEFGVLQLIIYKINIDNPDEDEEELFCIKFKVPEHIQLRAEQILDFPRESLSQ